MAKAVATVDYSLCRPDKCSVDGLCASAQACEKKTLRQEEKGEPPVQFGLCQGCSACATACPLKAIIML